MAMHCQQFLLQGSHVFDQDPTFSDGPGVDLRLEGSLISPHRVDKWEIPSNEIVIKELLGEGAFGKVYMGIIKCPIISPRRQSTDMNKSIFTSAAIKQLKRERIIIANFGNMLHINNFLALKCIGMDSRNLLLLYIKF